MLDRRDVGTCYIRRVKIYALGAIVILLSIPAIASAADNSWNVISGDWSDTSPCPWSLGTEPTSSDNAYIQNGGTATITQTGEACSYLYLGATVSGNSGTIEITGGNLSIGYSEYLGNTGTGTFTQSGGTNIISSSLYLANRYGSTGTYNLSGTGYLSARYEYLGYYGSKCTGTFTQNGGTNKITTYLFIGYDYGSTGIYNLSDTGQLSANYEYIGISIAGDYAGTGKIIQTGGTNTATYIEIGEGGTYTLTGGTLNINGHFENSGVWNLSNSSAVINAYSSIVDLSSTTLTNVGNASLNIDAHSLLIVPSGYNPANYFINFTNDGILHQSGSTLDISSAYSIYGIGSINDHINCQGMLIVTPLQSSYAINLNNGLTISGTGSVYLGVEGCLHVNDATSGMDSGSLVSYVEYIGFTSNGTFTQTGGTNSLTSFLSLGSSSSVTGTYNLNGGTLITNSISKGSGTAAFNFGGGTLQARSSFSFPMMLTGINGNANIDTARYSAVTISGILSGDGGLNKLGSGTLTLSGSNSYSGETDINAGTLNITGSISSSSLVMVNSSGILAGTGTVGPVMVNSGGHLSPGNSAGTLKIAGNLTINDGALLDFDLASTSASDKISMSSYTLYLNNQDFYDFTFTALSGFGNGTYTLIDAKTISGNLGSNLTGNIGNYSATLSTYNNDLILTVVPEPGTWLLLASTCMAIFVGKRMRRKKAVDCRL
jgi:autotransporter-associated beta strand protein